MPAAFRAKEEIQSAFSNANIVLTQGSSGDFIVKADDTTIFTKKDGMNRFPHDNEITELLKKAGY